MARTPVLPKKITSLLSKSHLLSVSQMLEKFEMTGDSFNKTSVYRALEKLMSQGKVCKQSFGESEAVYELRQDHHDHAVCTTCQKVTPIDCHDHDFKVPGFEVDHHHTTVYGVCDSCKK